MMVSEPRRILFAQNGTPKDRELSAALLELNYEVLPVSSFEKAVEVSKSGKADLVLASAEGAVKGLELCDHLRTHTKTKTLPILLISESSELRQKFSAHEAKKERASGYIRYPVPAEEVVDWIERLIGLPPPPDGNEPEAMQKPQEIGTLRKRVEELQEKVLYYQGQAKDLSLSGEKSAQDVAQVLNDLQNDLEKARSEKAALKDELQLLKASMAQREREAHGKEKLLEDLKAESDQRQAELKRELDDLRAAYLEAEQKHKRALNALREYYKGKTGQSSKLEKRVAFVEAELKKASEELANARSRAEFLDEENQRLQDDLNKEKERNEEARELLNKAKKLFS